VHLLSRHAALQQYDEAAGRKLTGLDRRRPCQATRAAGSFHRSHTRNFQKEKNVMQYLGLFLLLALIAALGFILFSPMLKGWRTQIFGYLTIGAGGLLPLAGELVDYLQTLDWRQYVLAADRKNLAVLAIVGGLGFVGVILRHLTTGPVGTKD
jgi:hypothetical protein